MQHIGRVMRHDVERYTRFDVGYTQVRAGVTDDGGARTVVVAKKTPNCTELEFSEHLLRCFVKSMNLEADL